MKRTRAGIMIAAVGSGSGKTTITCALLDVLKRKGLCVSAFKCGPDYIDPMFHRKIIGVPSHNLDRFFMGTEQLRGLYDSYTKENGIAVVEGAMGLFDGLGGIREEGSAYEAASILGLPVILIVDAHGMGRSLLPLLAGFLSYDREKRIAGVILNRTSENFYHNIAPVIEDELGLLTLGFMPARKDLVIESRHLGLKLPGEMEGLRTKIRNAAEILEKNVSIAKILKIACGISREETGPPEMSQGGLAYLRPRTPDQGDATVRIGVARDEAFCFYYEENLKLLEQAGAELVFFSPIHGEKLPDNLAGLLIGGGYPELYARELEENAGMRGDVYRACKGGMPFLAECGGFMYLHEALENAEGETYSMCGALPGKCFHAGKLIRFGYIELEEKNGFFLKDGARIKGHEFHYYDSENNGQSCIAQKPVSGQRFECVHANPNQFFGFPHLYYPSCPAFAEHFLEEARAFRKEKTSAKAHMFQSGM